MFGKKKAPLPEGIRLMHYEGLPSTMLTATRSTRPTARWMMEVVIDFLLYPTSVRSLMLTAAVTTPLMPMTTREPSI